MNDATTEHYFIIDCDILISYFHITQNSQDKYFINYMYTNKNYRNRGYMKKLLSYALNICKMNNINTVYSWTKITNVNSKNIFLSNNFTIDNIKDDNITFVKNL